MERRNSMFSGMMVLARVWKVPGVADCTIAGDDGCMGSGVAGSCGTESCCSSYRAEVGYPPPPPLLFERK